jgi:hypothetical protein
MDVRKKVCPRGLGRILRVSVPTVMISWLAGCATGGGIHFGSLTEAEHQALVDTVMSFSIENPAGDSLLQAFFGNLDAIFEEDYGPIEEDDGLPPAPGGGAVPALGPLPVAAQQAIGTDGRHNACDLDKVLVLAGPNYAVDQNDLIWGPWGEICTRKGSHKFKPSPNYKWVATATIRPSGIIGATTSIPSLGLDEGVNRIFVQCPDDFDEPCFGRTYNNTRVPVEQNFLIHRHRPEKGNPSSQTHYSAAAWVYLSAAGACFTCQRHGWCSSGE